jgi:hypothetical protein
MCVYECGGNIRVLLVAMMMIADILGLVRNTTANPVFNFH